MLTDCEDAKSIEECIEMATCDACDEEEEIDGWLICLGEVFEDLKEVKIFGDPAGFVGFEMVGRTVVTVCTKNKKKAKVTLDSLSLPAATKAQKLWICIFHTSLTILKRLHDQ